MQVCKNVFCSTGRSIRYSLRNKDPLEPPRSIPSGMQPHLRKIENYAVWSAATFLHTRSHSGSPSITYVQQHIHSW